jgi:hypothetical protein
MLSKIGVSSIFSIRNHFIDDWCHTLLLSVPRRFISRDMPHVVSCRISTVSLRRLRDVLDSVSRFGGQKASPCTQPFCQRQWQMRSTIVNNGIFWPHTFHYKSVPNASEETIELATVSKLVLPMKEWIDFFDENGTLTLLRQLTACS